MRVEEAMENPDTEVPSVGWSHLRHPDADLGRYGRLFRLGLN